MRNRADFLATVLEARLEQADVLKKVSGMLIALQRLY
jgi:hypothetical protein